MATSLQSLWHKMGESPEARFLATVLLALTGFCTGLVVYWESFAILTIMVAPQPLVIAATIALVTGGISACIPISILSPSVRGFVLSGTLFVAFVVSGVFGYYFGEALTGI